ncbi:hypothetical protein SCALM49S_07099 [Streptomyces californicus]
MQDEGEFVTAEAADCGAGARPGGEPGAECLEYGVSRRVSQGVVHGLEVVFPDYAWIDLWGAAL